VSDSLRQFKDLGLAYIPPTFYQEMSYYLPWSLRIATAVCPTALPLACARFVLRLLALLVQKYKC
jgi:hypothetical protein